MAGLLARALALLRDAAQDIAGLGAARPLADALALLVVKADARQLQAAHGNLDDLALVRRDDVLLADDVAEVLLDHLFDFLVMPLAVALGAPMQIPAIGTQ